MANILIVDDVQTDRDLVGRLVASAGHRPSYAVDGEQALSVAREQRPDLILMDVVMPRLDGFKTCRQLKKDTVTATIPVVLITSKGGEADKFWGQKQGADGHLAKPFTPDQLLTAISRFV